MADTHGGLTSPAIEAAREVGRKAIAESGLLSRALGDKFRNEDPAGAFLYSQIFDLNPPPNNRWCVGKSIARIAELVHKRLGGQVLVENARQPGKDRLM